MNSFWRKNYRGVSFLVLAVLFVGWTMFLDNSEKSMALERADKQLTEIAQNTPTVIPPVSPTDVLTHTASVADAAQNDDDPAITAEPDEPADVTDIADSVTPIDAPDDTVTDEPEPVISDVQTPTVIPTEIPVPTEVPVQPEFKFKYAVANVVDKLNIRAAADTGAELIGYLPPNSYCEILEWGESWSKIKSGKITGYAYSKYLLTNEDAVERMSRDGKLLVKVVSNSLNIREFPNTESTVLSKASYGQKYTYLPMSSVDGWYCIQFTETQVGYMSADFLEVFIDMKTAVSVE